MGRGREPSTLAQPAPSGVRRPAVVGGLKDEVDLPRRQQLGGSLCWRGTARQTCGQLSPVWEGNHHLEDGAVLFKEGD